MSKAAPTRRGQERRDAAVAACITLLTREGRGAFSMRRIAADLGISLGNLQHHFRSEQELLGAVVESVLAESIAHIEARFGARFGAGPMRATELADVLDHLLAIHLRRTTSVLFFELWALASHDRGVRAVMVRFYRAYAERVSHALPGPPRSVAARTARAKAVVAMLEGMAVFAAGLGGAMTAEDWAAMKRAVLCIAVDAGTR